jgi:hypothetical protein
MRAWEARGQRQVWTLAQAGCWALGSRRAWGVAQRLQLLARAVQVLEQAGCWALALPRAWTAGSRRHQRHRAQYSTTRARAVVEPPWAQTSCPSCSLLRFSVGGGRFSRHVSLLMKELVKAAGLGAPPAGSWAEPSSADMTAGGCAHSQHACTTKQSMGAGWVEREHGGRVGRDMPSRRR